MQLLLPCTIFIYVFAPLVIVFVLLLFRVIVEHARGNRDRDDYRDRRGGGGRDFRYSDRGRDGRSNASKFVIGIILTYHLL